LLVKNKGRTGVPPVRNMNEMKRIITLPASIEQGRSNDDVYYENTCNFLKK
jgi:hypothetical protein